ncbi:MAG: hydantoinase/oxoprolinase family protein [Acidimicrobiia bacterium]|nr:hydantoinase/oxoprolinase family protein [Acidimicrobiia bacterium]
MRVAVDIGGTFTDAVATWPDGRTESAKALSIAGAQDAGVMQAVSLMEVSLPEVRDFIHGTTTALNALLQRNGASMALVVTGGFRDVYEIGRASRPEMYNIHYRRPELLLRRRDIFEVEERTLADGTIRTPLDSTGIRDLAERLRGRYESVAVCFMHSFRWPAHEQEAAAILREALPGISVVASHEVTAEWREYERWSTTLVSAYVTPRIRDYLEALEMRLAEGGLRSPLHVMQSNGGVMTAQTGLRRAAQTLFSGPVGGTVASEAIGGAIESNQLICVDMGGTSFDVSLVVDGRADIDSEVEIEGHPVLTPSVAIHSLGAGGGSIIWVEAGGLRVGPASAGAMPGPACYGHGGVSATVTDANALLGRIPEIARFAGALDLDLEAAEAALEKVAAELGLDARELALGAIEVVNAMMADGIREITVGRGIDPRDFDLLAFGGAGPLHAAALADEMGMSRVIVPHAPGVLSAWGMLQADVRHDLARSLYGRFDSLDHEAVGSAFEDLRGEGRTLLAEDGVEASDMDFRPSVDLRYFGQEYTLTVPIHDAQGLEDPARVAADFHAAYQARYGHSNPGEAVELVSVRISAVGLRRPTDLSVLPGSSPARALMTLPADFGNGPEPTDVYRRADMGRSQELDGPAIVLESGCTTLVPPGWRAATSDRGHLVMERGGS